MSTNLVILRGRIGQEPVIKTTQNGTKVANFSIATSEKWKNKEGEKQEKTEWHRIVVWGAGAELIERNVEKGMEIEVHGQLETRKWADNNGVDKYITEVVLKPFKSYIDIVKWNNNQSENVEPQVGSEPSGIEDDIPF